MRLAAPVALLLSACSHAERAPNPTAYDWPERIAWHVDYVSEAQRDRVPLLQYAETKTTRLMLRNGQYVGTQDSVLKTSQRPGEPLVLVPYLPEDTLAFFVKLGAHGELTDVSLGCDPAVPACAEALPSSVALELRRIIPRLPIWEAPQGGGWVDTLSFDDASRPGGTRGAVITTYTGRRDTIIDGQAYWVVGWRSERSAFRRGAGAAGIAAEGSVEEAGITLVDKRRLLPVFSTWAGAVAAPPAMRAIGATASGFRGRAFLGGSSFDSTMVRATP
jgi:hypothetical protein